jgi:hypothetical protein
MIFGRLARNVLIPELQRNVTISASGFSIISDKRIGIGSVRNQALLGVAEVELEVRNFLRHAIN